jgi:hypothetical protein
MVGQRITKRVVDGLRPRATEFAVWDAKLPGFGIRVRPSGARSYVVVYRAGAGRGAPVRRQSHAVGRQKARKGHTGSGGPWSRPSGREGHRTGHSHGSGTVRPVHV